MNSFKTILALCVVMAASCSASSYRTQQSAWGSQPAAAAAPLPLQNGGGYGNKVWGAASPAAVQPTFSAPAPVQDAPVAPAPAQQSAFPVTTQQICTCVAVPAAAAAQQSAAPAPAAAAPLADVPLQQATPQTYSAPAAAPQTWSAPAVVQAAAPAPVAATQFYSAPVQQQQAAPAPVFRPAPSAARPSYSTGY